MSEFYAHTNEETIVGTATVDGYWSSGEFLFDRVIRAASIRVYRADTSAAIGTVDVNVNGSNIVTITDSGVEYSLVDDFANTIAGSTKFSFLIHIIDAIVSKVELFEQSVVTVNETTTITKKDIDTCRSFIIEHAKSDAPCYIHTATLEGNPSVNIDGTTYDGKIPRTLAHAKQHTMHIDSDGLESCTVYMRRTVKVPKHIHIVNDGPVLPWLIERYEVPENSRIASILCIGGGGTMNLYFNGDNNPVDFNVDPGIETPAEGTSEAGGQRQRFGSLELDFVGGSLNGPSSIHIFLVESIMVDGPVILENPEHQTGLFFHFKKPNHFMVQKIGYSQNSTSIRRLTSIDPNKAGGSTIPDGDVHMQERQYVQTGGGLKIHSLGLWPLIDEPSNGIIRESAELTDMPPWEYKRYVFDKPRIVTGGSFSGSGGSVAVYGDSDNLLGSIPSAGQEFPFSLGTPTRSVTIKTADIDDGVQAISVFTKEVVEVGEAGFSKTGGDGWVNMFAAFPTANRFVCGRILGTSPTLIVNDITITLLGYLAKLPSRQAAAITHKITVLDVHPEQITLLPLTIQPVKGNKLRVVNDGFIPEWMHTRYELEGTDRLTSVYVKGASSINLYLDGVEGGTALPVTDGVETVIPLANGRCGAFEFDFADDSAVSEVIFWADPMRIIGQDDIILEGEDHWMGRRFKFPDRGEWACVSVGADASVDMTLECVETPASTHTVTLSDGFMVALPRDKEGSAWTLSLDADGQKVYNFVAKARTRMPVNETIVRITGQRKEIHPWWYGRWDIPADRKLTGIIVDADSTVGVRVYATGANADDWTDSSISNNHEVRIEGMADVSSVDIKFDAGDEYKVNEAFLVFQQERLCPPDGIVLENEVSWRSLRFSFQEKNRFAVAAVKAENYTNLVMDVYRNGSLSTSIDVNNGNPFLIPDTTDDVQWEVDLYYSAGTPNGNISSLTLKPFITKAIQDDTYVMKQKGQIAEWLYTRYELPKKQRIRSCYVSTSHENPCVAITPYPTLTQIRTRTPAYKETSLSVPPCGAFTFQVENGSGTPGVLIDVDDVILHMERHVPIENRHTIMRDISPTEGIRNRVYRFPDTGSFCAIRVVADDIILSKFTADATTDIITHTNADMANLSKVRLTSTQILPAPLAVGTDYYIIAVTALTCKFATSLALAQAGTAVNITSAGTGIHTIHDAAVINVTPYAGDVAQRMIEVTNDELTDLDQNMPNAREWTVDIESTFTIREIHLLTKEEEPYNGWSWIVKRDQAPWSWRHHRTIAPKPMEFSCARILADVYPLELQVFNIDNGLVFSYSVSNAQPFRLRKEQPGRVWRIDVLGAPDSRIFEVGLSTSMGGLLNAAPTPR